MGEKNTYKSIDGVFDKYYMGFAARIEADLRRSLNAHESLKDGISENCIYKAVDKILEQVLRVTSLSLLDYYDDRREKDKAMTYDRMNEVLSTSMGRKAFHKRYPMAEILSDQMIRNYTGRFDQILDTVSRFREEILEFTGCTNKFKCTEMDFAKGDLHENTFVVIFKINGKKLVLKKRSHIGERVLQVFYDEYLKEKIVLPIQEVKILDEDTLIQEFAEYGVDFDDEELRKYYVCFGLMAGIFSIIGSRDMHSENVIATKKGPNFIDMEAAITSTMPFGRYSLLKETLLFNCSENGIVYGKMDLSAFSGTELEFECREILRKGKDDIHIGTVKKKQVLMNIPKRADGVEVDPRDYTAQVKLGYETAIKVFFMRKKEIIRKLAAFKDYNNRLVLRNTAFYGTYLQNLCMPEYMKSVEKTEKLLSLLKEKSIRDKEMLEEEVNCLRKHIIPYFTASHYIDTDEIRDRFLERLKNYDEKTVERERHYFDLALKIKSTPKKHGYTSAEDRIKTELSDYKKLCMFEDFFNYGTYDTTITDNIIDYRNELYTFGGTMLFLQKLNPKLKDMVKKTVTCSKPRKNISGLNGYHAGILLENMLGINREDVYAKAQDLMNINDDVDFSTYGSSILILDRLYKKTGDERYLEDIREYGSVYMKRMEERTLTGLFHGYSGDAVVLDVLSKYFDRQSSYKKIETLLQKEDKQYSEKTHNWIDTRKNVKYRDMTAISYGAVGIVLSRMFLLRDKGLPKKIQDICKKDIQRGIEKIIMTSRQDFGEDSLVNGYAGALTVLRYAADQGYVSQKDSDSAQKYLNEGKALLTKEPWGYGKMTGLYNPAFSSGRMGTLFSLWYINRKGKVS